MISRRRAVKTMSYRRKMVFTPGFHHPIPFWGWHPQKLRYDKKTLGSTDPETGPKNYTYTGVYVL